MNQDNLKNSITGRLNKYYIMGNVNYDSLIEIEKSVKEAILQDQYNFKIFKELIILELQQKEYSRLTIKRLLDNYYLNKREIFGDWDGNGN